MAAMSFVFLMILVLAGGGLLLLLLLLGLALVATKRPGVAALAGGLLLLGLVFAIGGPALLWFLSAQSYHNVVPAVETEVRSLGVPILEAPVNVPPMPVADNMHLLGREIAGVPSRWLSFAAILLPMAGVVALIIILSFRKKKPADEVHGARWWPLLLVPVLVLLFLVGSVRVERTVSHNNTLTQRQAEQAAQLARTQAETARRMAQMDIHQLMDQVDAPRIPLAPEPPQAPEPVTLADAPSDAIAVPSADAAEVEDEAAPKDEIDQAEPRVGEEVGAEESSEAAPNQEQSDNAKANEENVGEEKADEQPPTEEPSAEATEQAEHDDGAESRPPEEAEATDDTESPLAPQPQSPAKTGAQPGEVASIAARPDWVDDPPKRIGNVVRQVIETDEYATRGECDRAADILLIYATYDHLARLVGIRNYAEGVRRARSLHPATRGMQILDEHDGRLSSLGSMGIGIDYIRREIAKDEHLEINQRSFGPMKKLYTLVEFSPAVDRELRARWEAREREERLAVVGGSAAAILALLGSIWGLMKIDTLTKGYYTKWLFVGVPAAIIGGGFLLTALATW